MRDIVDDIDCLQVWQHASAANLYIRVTNWDSIWKICSTIDGGGGQIASASSGGVCPAADSRNNEVRVICTNQCHRKNAD